jgi:hypothetical protein
MVLVTEGSGVSVLVGPLLTGRRSWLPSRVMNTWRYGLTLLPLETVADEESVEATVEAVVRSRLDLGWELVRKAERDDTELLVFRRPA